MNVLLAGPDANTADAVTGLPGREAGGERLAQWLSRGEPVHAMLLGLRRLDAVNVTYGTSAGDAALLEVSQCIRRFAARALDGPWFVTRGGGGKFLLVASEGCSREHWRFLAGELIEAMASPIPVGGRTLRLSPRAALARGVPGDDPELLLDRLAQSLVQLMENTGRRLAWADGFTGRSGRSAAQFEADLLAAIDRDEIEVLFQPQFACSDDRLCGAEALARWNHPVLGQIGAGPLFTVAERLDHIPQLSRQIARRALDRARDWPSHLRLSLNVTPTELAMSGYADDLLELVASSRFSPERLTLEVTEQVLLGDLALAAETFGKLAAAGVRLALDDFGAGFCNFRYLKLLPLHYLKLDRSLIEEVAHNDRDLAILRGIVSIARALGLLVIAEGIEDEAQLAIVRREGCEVYQGFLRSTPVPATEFLVIAGA